MNKTLQALKNKLLKISSKTYAFIIIISILLVLLSLSSLSENIKKENLIKNCESSATFDSYRISRSLIDDSLLSIKIYLENGDEIEIDCRDYSRQLENSLAELKKGDSLRFVLNPQNGFVLLVKSDVLIYETDNAILSTPVAAILLILSGSFFGVSVTFLILKKVEKKKAETFIKQKVAEFNTYSYKIAAISKENRWVTISCNEVDAAEDAAVFANLLKRIAVKLNNGYWEGNFVQVGEQRYKIKNDPLVLTYQYDTLFGIVIEYTEGTHMNAILRFLLDVAEIRPK